MKPLSRIIYLLLILLAMAVFVFSYVLWGIKWPQGSNVSFVVNPNTAQVTDELAAVNAAAASWSTINPAGLRFSYAGPTSITDRAGDGQNEVCWKNQGNNGILATAYAWSSGTTMTEVDLVFNNSYTWSTSGSNYDVETVALHEIGHWAGLDHSPSGIMAPSYGGLQRSIDNDAKAGFIAMYGGTGSNPVIGLDPGSLSFTESGQKTLRVRNSGSGTLNYTIDADRNWLSVTPAGGSSGGEWNTVTVNAAAAGLSAGSYAGTIRVSSADALNSPQIVDVSLIVSRDQPPTVNITQPANGATVYLTVEVRADAADDYGVQKVDFYVDGTLKLTDTAAPYFYSWDTTKTSNGQHVVKAAASDTAGQTASDEKTVTVKNCYLTIRAGTGGTTDPVPGTYVYGAGTSATVRATANSGYRFGNWSGDATGTANPIAMAMDADKTLTANFIRQYTLTISAGAGGTTNPVPGSTLYDEGSTATITALPEAKFRFIFWDGDAQGTANPLALTMNSDRSIGASFIRIIYPPSNLQGQKVLNRSLSQAEYINVLTWEANPDNDGVNLVFYRIYRSNGDDLVKIADLPPEQFSFRHRPVEKNTVYNYVIVAVNDEGREGDPGYLTIR